MRASARAQTRGRGRAYARAIPYRLILPYDCRRLRSRVPAGNATHTYPSPTVHACSFRACAHGFARCTHTFHTHVTACTRASVHLTRTCAPRAASPLHRAYFFSTHYLCRTNVRVCTRSLRHAPNLFSHASTNGGWAERGMFGMAGRMSVSGSPDCSALLRAYLYAGSREVGGCERHSGSWASYDAEGGTPPRCEMPAHYTAGNILCGVTIAPATACGWI